MENENRKMDMDELIELRITKADFEEAKKAAEAFGYYRGKADAYREMLDAVERFTRGILYHKWQQSWAGGRGMAKYIKLEDAINNYPILIEAYFDFDERLHELPTIEIVHCKDCKFFYQSPGASFKECELDELPTTEDRFCSWAERRE